MHVYSFLSVCPVTDRFWLINFQQKVCEGKQKLRILKIVAKKLNIKFQVNTLTTFDTVSLLSIKCLSRYRSSFWNITILSWGNASHSVIQPLKTLINRAVRIMSFAPFGRLDTKPIFQHLKLLNVEETFLLETSKFIYKNKNGLLPISSIAHHFDRPISNSNRTLRLRSHPTVAPYNLLSSFAKKIHPSQSIPNLARYSTHNPKLPPF